MPKKDRNFELRLARSADDLVAAQRLRYRVFVRELGATGPTVDHENRLETDGFDTFYDHLVLVDRRRDPAARQHIVGVYRLMRGDVAAANRGFYTSNEYDLSPLLNSGRQLLELGRSCVHPDVRGGVAMYILWNGLADYCLEYGVEILFGVASFNGINPAPILQSLSMLHHQHLAPPELRVTSRETRPDSFALIAADSIDRRVAMAQTPPLIKAYLRLGGKVGEGVFIDHDFNTVDVCLMMDTDLMSRSHRQILTRGKEVRGD